MRQCTLKLNILQNVVEEVVLRDCVTDKSTDENVRPDNCRSFVKRLCRLLLLNYLQFY